MRTTQEIRYLLEKLDKHPADALEDQDLDFKEWNTRSMKDAVALAIEMAVCLAHGSGGTVVFGVSDKNIGSDKAT
jgi:ATP-dependent DNA helicase RecG